MRKIDKDWVTSLNARMNETQRTASRKFAAVALAGGLIVAGAMTSVLVWHKEPLRAAHKRQMVVTGLGGGVAALFGGVVLFRTRRRDPDENWMLSSAYDPNYPKPRV